MDQNHYTTFLDEIRIDVAEAEQQITDLRELEKHVEKYLNRKYRDSESKSRKKTNPTKHVEKASRETVQFGPNGFPVD